MALVVVVGVVAAGATVGIIYFLSDRSKTRQEDQIAQVTRDFVTAVETNATTRAASCYCAPEAQNFLETNDAEPLDDSGAAPSQQSGGLAAGLKIRDIVLRGDTASAVVANTQGDQTLYYRKEGGTWKICDGAMADFQRAG